MRRLSLCASLAFLTLLGACAASGPSRQLYQWTDASGSVRYTTFPGRIPATRAHTRQVVEPGASARQNAGGPRTPFESALPPEAAPPPGADPLDVRIAELEARIEADEDALKALISDPEQAAELRSSPRLREIGTRLPELQAELEELRLERARAAADG
jgi:hypothetical protein